VNVGVEIGSKEDGKEKASIKKSKQAVLELEVKKDENEIEEKRSDERNRKKGFPKDEKVKSTSKNKRNSHSVNALDDRTQESKYSTVGERLPPSTAGTPAKASRYLGVGFNKRNQKWEARFLFQGRSIFLGLFADEIAAARAYDEAVFLNRGRDAPRNFEYAGAPPVRQSSKFRGVSFNKRSNKWKVTIKVQKSSIHGGLFDDEVAAAKEYDKIAKELHGQRARLNFPDEV